LKEFAVIAFICIKIGPNFLFKGGKGGLRSKVPNYNSSSRQMAATSSEDDVEEALYSDTVGWVLSSVRF